MTEQQEALDVTYVDGDIIERIMAYRDAKRQSQQQDGIGWIDQDTLDYSIRGVEAFNIK